MLKRWCILSLCAVLCGGTARAAGWELRRDDLRPERPPVTNGVVSVGADGSGAFPRYLNELGVRRIRIAFTDVGRAKRTLSVVWSGGSMGPDKFAVSVDGAAAGASRTADSARRPYAWNRDEMSVKLGAGREHILQISALPEYPSAVEFAGIRLAAPGTAPYQPLCYESIRSLARYETELGGPGAVVESPHLSVFAPRANATDARKLAQTLEKAYGELRTLCGTDTDFRFSVEHYPPGHKRGWGGISGAGTIGYQIEALERFSHMGTRDVRGFAGYTEEMSHAFTSLYRCGGTYEAMGVALQEEMVRRLVPKSVADAFWLPEHRQWATTHAAYVAAGKTNPDPREYPNGVLYTRILNDVFLTLREEYGPRMWPDFFATLRKMDYPLHRAKGAEFLRTYADVFTTMFRKDMRARFETYGIDLKAEPPWGWQTRSSE